ncbi:hypothetical protein J6590_043481 [Homalodisca vitripennis]|nr:hypothetical protein J6590_043481 [Homalodisca vitripennis]
MKAVRTSQKKCFKKLTSNEIDFWRCSSCRETVDATSTTPVCSNIPNLLFSSINDLESSLSENNILENLEDNGEKLQAAAKIGAALLEENNFLKEKNLRLEIKIELLEEKILKFEAEENKYIGKIEDLLQNISETQVQLEKEKKLRMDTQSIFEEHDSQQGQLVDDYVKTIDHLKNTISTLEKKITSQKTQQSELTIYSNKGTQAEPLHLTTQPATVSSSFLIDLAQLKDRQNSLENAVKALTAQIQDVPLITEKHIIAAQSHKIEKRNFISVSLQIAVNKQRLAAQDLDQIKIGGVCQTPPQKQNTTCVTQGSSQTTTDQQMTGGVCQTPPQTDDRGSLSNPAQKQNTPVDSRLQPGSLSNPPQKQNTTCDSAPAKRQRPTDDSRLQPKTTTNNETKQKQTPYHGGSLSNPPQKQNTTCVTQGSSQTTTDQQMTGGVCQTPPQKQNTTCVTQGSSQTTTDQQMTGESGESVKPPQKQNTTCVTQGSSQTTTDQQMTGGVCQTPPQKQNTTCVTQGSSQTTTDQQMTGGVCQTPPQKQNTTCVTQGSSQTTTDQQMTGGVCQTPPQKQNTTRVTEDSNQTTTDQQTKIGGVCPKSTCYTNIIP